MWATIGGSIASLLAALVKPLILFLAYLQGERAATSEIKAEQAQKDKDLAEDYLKNRTTTRTPDDTLKRMQDGTF